VRAFLRPIIDRDLVAVKQRALAKDPKTRLQEWAQGERGIAPRYKVLEASGPDHDKIFTTQVTIDQKRVGVGRGKSKQRASQAAAAMALHVLGLSAPEYVRDEEVESQYPVAGPDSEAEEQPSEKAG
jgi:dsRNA-specific ribonuclease